jgi:hypothetical protein
LQPDRVEQAVAEQDAKRLAREEQAKLDSEDEPTKHFGVRWREISGYFYLRVPCDRNCGYENPPHLLRDDARHRLNF